MPHFHGQWSDLGCTLDAESRKRIERQLVSQPARVRCTRELPGSTPWP